MINGIYLIIAVAIALAGLFYGFWRGFTGQIAAVLGLAFGTVASRMLTTEFEEYFRGFCQSFAEPFYLDLAVNVVCSSTIFIVVFLLFLLATPILRGALSVFEIGMFNRLLGAFVALLIALVWVSIAFNVMVCLNPDCGLLNYEQHNDGNIAAAVMDIAPGLLGSQGADELALLVQLRDASYIS